MRPASRDTLRVCLVSPLPPPPGGIARWTALIMRHASERHPEVEILLVNTAVRLRSSVSLSKGKRILTGTLEAVRILASVTRCLLLDGPDVLHLNSPAGLGVTRDLVVVFLARAVRVPVVYHLRFGRVPLIAAKNTVEWRILRQVARQARTVICIDAATAAAFATFAPEVATSLIPNCVDFSSLPAPVPFADRNEIVFVGSHVVTKGVEELADAWATVARPGWILRMIGAASNEMVGKLRELAGTSSIVFDGPLPHAETLQRMAEGKIVVLPSHTEGFPNVVVEAMALGRPVIATPVGAIPEMLGGGAGVLVPVRDVLALANALVRMMDDGELRRTAGLKGQERARRRYSVESAFCSYFRVWENSGRSV